MSKTLTALSLIAGANLLSCIGPLTEVWVMVESNIPIAAQNASGFAQVRVQASVGGAQFWDTPYSLQDGAHALPGHFVLRPTSAEETRPIELIAEAQSSAGMSIVRQRAVFTFSRGRRQVLRLYLASECAGQRQLDCEAMGRTCGQGGVCIEPERMMLPEYYPDAQVPEAGTRDATVDPSLPTPQLLSPLSGSVMSTRSPTITWRYASGAPESTIDICTDRACTTVLQTQTLPSGTTSYPVANVPAGHRVLFFRVFSASAMGLGPSSPVWQLRLPKIDANPAAVSTALRTDADFDGDGLADIAYDVSDGMTRVLRIAFGSHVRPPAMLEIQPPMGMDIPVIGSPAVVGDVNGDGFVDLAVKTGTGVVLFRGNAIRSQILTQPTVITGSVAPEFGNSIAGVGDVSTDGYADIVLGEWIPMSRRALSGFLVQGSATGSLVATNFVTGQAGARVPSEFGRGISAGDCNGDHVNEVAISDPVFNFSQLGNITLYHPLGSMGMVETVTEMTMSGVTAGVPRFGTDVTLRGDNNGDGLSDVLASAPNGQNIEPNGTSGYGALLWAGSPVNGATRAMIPLLKGGDSGTRGLPEQRVAETIAQVGDVNGDGLGDIAMSSRTVAPQGSSVFIFRGIRGGSPMVGLTLMGQSPTAAIGSVIGGIGDFDGDGFDDVAIPTTEASPAASGLKLYYGGMMFLEASPAVISAGTIGGVAAQ